MDLATYSKFFIALALVLALIALIAWVGRRFGLGNAIAPRRGAGRRLKIVEAATIDSKRRLVLVRRDEIDHLLLLGGGSDIVVEQNIIPPPEPPSTVGNKGTAS